MAKYDQNEFFSAERYPLPMACPECGKTMRPVHKHRVPDMPRHYFCTFCDAMIPEDHPGVRFRKPSTNADLIRAMSDEELAEEYAKRTWRACPPLDNGCQGGLGYGCTKCWLDWLKQEVKYG